MESVGGMIEGNGSSPRKPLFKVCFVHHEFHHELAGNPTRIVRMEDLHQFHEHRNAKSCGAVKHCIQTVWEHQTLPPDEDDVCKICLEMVKEARDQLESNETQEELKEVFEGSCKLIPISIVSKECCKLADDFVPELVETLASQMNPQVVCSVAGLCNNEWVDKLLEEAKCVTQISEKSICILTDSKGAIFNIIKYVPNVYAHRIIPIHKQLRKLKELQKEITFQWIPNHCGIPGNEKVDKFAKQATYLQPTPLQVISLSSAFASVKSHFTNLWINNWLSSDKGKVLQSVQKKPNDLEMYKNLPRHVQTFLTRP
ncbi:hypothetical protein ANN_11779 [Periplaneta americana]|uniref:RNase H type-1 domain-containing protein n=1 Tax=Periplaneta americana TaxID=6978 RepID=A0ABQ8T7H1_PERAM|nr:hypothetical protein ANN_11779 [Periplaneta americana]